MPAQARRHTFHAGRPAGEHLIHKLLRVHARTCESHAGELETMRTLGVTDQTYTIRQPALGFLARAGVGREAGTPARAGGRARVASHPSIRDRASTALQCMRARHYARKLVTQNSAADMRYTDTNTGLH